MRPKISVIVPVYNTEKYLDRCIQSILAQTYTDFELLLVDDGSTDSSGAICDKYAEQDSRVRVFHKENGGVSSARNQGLDNAKGEWITFVDSDDWVDREFFNILSKSSKPDILISYYVADGWSRWVSVPFEDATFNTKNMKVFLNKYLISCNMPWGKWIKRSLIETFKIRFDSNFSYGEDTLFIMDCLSKVESVETNSESLYHYDCTNSMSLSKITRDVNYYILLIDEISRRIKILSAQFNADNNDITASIIRMHVNFIFNKLDYRSSAIKENLYAICSNENVKRVLADYKRKKTFKRRIFDWLLRHKFYNFIIFIMRFN